MAQAMLLKRSFCGWHVTRDSMSILVAMRMRLYGTSFTGEFAITIHAAFETHEVVLHRRQIVEN